MTPSWPKWLRRGGESREGDLPRTVLEPPENPKPMMPPIASPEVIQSSVTKLEKISQLRQALGLSEKSPLVDTAQMERDRDSTVNAYMEKQTEENLQGNNGFIDRNKQKWLEKKQRLENQTKKPSPIDRSLHTVGIFRLKANGIKDAEQIYSILEKSYLYTTDPLSLVLDLDSHVVQALQKFTPDKLQKGLDRVAILGFPIFNDYLGIPEFMHSVEILASIPDEQFQTACQELNRCFFLTTEATLADKKKGVISQDFKTLVEIVKFGKLTDGQKQQLDQIKKQRILNGSIAVKQQDATSHDGFVTISTALTNGRLPQQFTENLIFFLEDRLFRAAQRGGIEKLESSAVGFFDLSMLEQSGLLPYLKDLAQKNIDCLYFYRKLTSLADNYGAQEFTNQLAKVYKFTVDPLNHEWVSVFIDKRNDLSSDDFSVKALDAMEILYDNYAPFVNQRDELLQIADLLHALPLGVEKKVDRYLGFQATPVEIKINELRKSIESIPLETLTPIERSFVLRIKSFMNPPPLLDSSSTWSRAKP